ncbi:MAG TPA: hypothetical protein VIB99_03760 [Candidatus Limnocylindrales bacterium]
MPDAARPAGFSLEDAVLDIGGDIGALILYTDAEYAGREIEVSLLDEAAGQPAEAEHEHGQEHDHGHDHTHEHERGLEGGAEPGHSGRVHTAIHERRAGDLVAYAGIYPELQQGTYRVWIDDPALPNQVTIVGGEVAELDWRRPRS